MKNLVWKRMLTTIAVLALLLMIPAGTLLADSDEGPDDPDENEEGLLTPEMEGLDDPEGPEGGKAAEVAERIAAAMILGIPPGHLNLIDRLAAASDPVLTREEALALWQEAPIQSIMQEIKRLRFEAKGKELSGESGKGHAYGHNKGNPPD